MLMDGPSGPNNREPDLGFPARSLARRHTIRAPLLRNTPTHALVLTDSGAAAEVSGNPNWLHNRRKSSAPLFQVNLDARATGIVYYNYRRIQD
jgi:hypothetical protein